MSIEELKKRSGSKCELCGSEGQLKPYSVSAIDEEIYICEICNTQIDNNNELNVNHLRCLNDSMWSDIPAVQITVWRLLNRLNSETWAQDLLDMMYLEEETLELAKSGLDENSDDLIVHKDSNGVILLAGDTVTLTKDLNVKGASFTAKRGTAVRRITLDPYNPEHIEGRVNGQKIVILTKYVKKSK